MMEFQPPAMQFLTPEESAQVDSALLTAQEKFSTRVALYSLRALKQIASATGEAIAQLSVEQVAAWVDADPTLDPDQGFDAGFRTFFSQLVFASLRPLSQAAQMAGKRIEALTPVEVIAWFEQESKRRLQQDQG